MGRSHFSFVGERKVCKRKPAARRLREKALYCPFLKEGVRNVARRPVSEITPTFVRARAHSFPLSKRARLFPSAAYRRPRPRGRRRTYSTIVGWDVTVWHGQISRATNQRVWENMLAFAASREARCRAAVTLQPTLISHERPARIARSPGCRGSPPAASHETFRRVAVCIRQETGNHTRPASREARRRAAVSPQPTRISHERPARIARSPGCRGSPPAQSKGMSEVRASSRSSKSTLA